MAGDDLGELLGKFLESLLNPQVPAGKNPPPSPGQPRPGQSSPGQSRSGPRGFDPRGTRSSLPGGRPPERQPPDRRFPDRQPSRTPFGRPTVPMPVGQGQSSIESLVEAEPVTGDDVAEHVDQHLDSRRVTSRADHFGEDVALADDHLDTHQRQLFGQGPQGGLASRRLGTATAAPPVTSSQPTHCIVQDVAALLSSPQNLRAAFVLGEILRRPEW